MFIRIFSKSRWLAIINDYQELLPIISAIIYYRCGEEMAQLFWLKCA